MLRRIDLLTLGLFAVWCLSPLGSQGLQRSYGTKPLKNMKDDAIVSYLNFTGPNQLFSPGTIANGTVHDTKLQIVIDYFTAAFLPEPRRELIINSDQDRYDNPTIPNINLLKPETNVQTSHPGETATVYTPNDFKDDVSDLYQDLNRTSAWGIPLKLPPMVYNDTYANQTVRAQQNAQEINPEDYNTFEMQTSFYNFTCAQWSTLDWATYKNVYDADDSWAVSGDSRFGLSMVDSLRKNADGTLKPDYRHNYLATVSLETYPNTTFNNDEPDETWKMAFMECTYNRVFMTVLANCTRNAGSAYLPVCYNEAARNVVTDADSDTPYFRDFAKEWLYGTDLVKGSDVITICKFLFISSVDSLK
jgi:hypothetical protein